MNSSPAPSLAGRLVSLDAYRGFIMLAMVSASLGTQGLAGDPHWGWLADQMEHRKWEGCTFWDLIQPSFMFMVGVAMPFAFARRTERGESWGRQFLHVVKRCLLLIGIGIVMDSFGRDRVTVQFIRVLQQIAIGYFIAFLVLRTGPPGQAIVALLLLAAHTLAYWFSAGGPAAWDYAYREVNIGRSLDQAMHEPFVMLGYPDIMPLSKGFYVTFNAVSSAATILIGVLAGELLRRPFAQKTKALALLVGGAVLFGTGLLLEQWVPMIKRLWTASFALYAAGWTCWMMCLFYTVIDIAGWRGWAWPLVVVGVNSIFIYVSAGLLNGTIRNVLKPFVSEPLRPLGPWAAVVLAVLVTFVQWLLCLFLYRQRVFLKV
jgi:heparan-alpha-glucosaminide N-acetyltransferase